jgi:hypothetical protein
VVAVAVAHRVHLTVALAALVLSFFPFQQQTTQAQPQAHPQSQQAAQIQF